MTKKKTPKKKTVKEIRKTQVTLGLRTHVASLAMQAIIQKAPFELMPFNEALKSPKYREAAKGAVLYADTLIQELGL